jgi:hypothetical protein
MKDHSNAVVVMPENLERRVNVADFVLSQERKEPPKLRRSFGSGRPTKANARRRSKSPRRRRSRDIVQDVYDRIGVNYVKGQNSVEQIYESSMPSNVSRASEVSTTDVVTKPSKSFRKPDRSLAIDTRSEVDDEERDDPKSVRSTRSVRSLMSAFGGGKSVASSKSASSRNKLHEMDYVNATRVEEVREKIIECSNNDNDMDGTMSVISLDESEWMKRKQQQQGEVEKSQASRDGVNRSRQPSFQTSTSDARAKSSSNVAQATLKTPTCHSSTIDDLRDGTIDKIIEIKLQARLAELNSSFEEKFRRLEERTTRRMEEMEKKLTESSKIRTTVARNPREKYERFRS